MRKLTAKFLSAWRAFWQLPKLFSLLVALLEQATKSPTHEALICLRIKPHELNNRKGRAVTIFVPEDVLTRLRVDLVAREVFINKIAGQAVRRACLKVWSSNEQITFPNGDNV